MKTAAAKGKACVVLIGIAQEKASVWRSWTEKGTEQGWCPQQEWGRQMAMINHFESPMGSLEAPDLGKDDGAMPTERIRGRPSTRRYTPAEKEQAVRLVRQLRVKLSTEQGTVKRVKAK